MNWGGFFLKNWAYQNRNAPNGSVSHAAWRVTPLKPTLHRKSQNTIIHQALSRFYLLILKVVQNLRGHTQIPGKTYWQIITQSYKRLLNQIMVMSFRS